MDRLGIGLNSVSKQSIRWYTILQEEREFFEYGHFKFKLHVLQNTSVKSLLYIVSISLIMV